LNTTTCPTWNTITLAASRPAWFAQTTDFDFDAVAAGLGEVADTTPDARAEAAFVLSNLFSWIWARGSFESAQLKFATLTAGIRPDLIGDDSYEALAAKFGVTKQAISKAAKTLENKLNFKFSRSRSAAGCEAMARAQIGHKPTNTKKRAANAAMPDHRPVQKDTATQAAPL